MGNRLVSEIVPSSSSIEKSEKVDFRTFVSDPDLEKKVIAETSSDKEQVVGSETFPHTDLLSITSEKTNQCTSGDTGQAVAEDADLYTTR